MLSDDQLRDIARAGNRKPGESIGVYSGGVKALRAVEAAVRADQIERLKLDAHFECNCVPELGPPHCHACGEAAGRPVPWAEAVHGPMPDRKAIRDAIFGGDQYGAPDRVLALLHGKGKNDE